MITKVKNLQEKRAVQFGLRLINAGYGYTIHIPSRQLASELTGKGFPISFMTVIAYWETLERLGYVKRNMQARINGVTYSLNRYAFRKLQAQASQAVV